MTLADLARHIATAANILTIVSDALGDIDKEVER